MLQGPLKVLINATGSEGQVGRGMCAGSSRCAPPLPSPRLNIAGSRIICVQSVFTQPSTCCYFLLER